MARCGGRLHHSNAATRLTAQRFCNETMKAEIQLENGKVSYLPGESIRGMAQWHGDVVIESIELRLIYHTSGRGTQDVCTVAVEKFERPGSSESRPFDLAAGGDRGSHPWSFSGKLISVTWGLELVVGGDVLIAECPVVVSPTGGEIDLYSHDDGSAQSESKRTDRLNADSGRR